MHLILYRKKLPILTQTGSDMSGSWDFGGQIATSDQFLKNSYLLFELA
jgi:hypothetical protein